MHPLLLALYHRLPAPARSAAATLRGLYLQLWRHGPERARLITEALERDQWSAEQWRAWTAERLAFVLHRAATRVPYYRDHWTQRRRRGDRASWDVLANWPVLDKAAIRAAPHAFVADDCRVGRMFHEQTSGTTGLPLDIWRTRRTVTGLYALATARTLRWHGIAEGVPWARLGGQLVTPAAQRRPPFWVWNARMRQLYMSTYHLAPDLIGAYLHALKRYRIAYLAGYPSALHALASEALRLRRTDLRMAAAFTNAEPLTSEQRDTIARAFHCPVLETYGMAETVAAASECPAGGLHLWPEVGAIEAVAEDGAALAPGATGELVCTGLLNEDMPLVRYRVGDRGRLADASACACQRGLPLLGGVEGRSTDLLWTADGRRVFWLNPVFYGLPIRESQIVQETLSRLRVRVAPAPGFDASHTRAIRERLVARMGAVDVRLEYVDQVPRTANGKVRAVVCALSSAEREAITHAGTPA